jgi:hypothetical protein
MYTAKETSTIPRNMAIMGRKIRAASSIAFPLCPAERRGERVRRFGGCALLIDYLLSSIERMSTSV